MYLQITISCLRADTDTHTHTRRTHIFLINILEFSLLLYGELNGLGTYLREAIL